MNNKKFQNFLTALIVIIIIVVIILIARMLFDAKEKADIKKNAEEAIINFDKVIEDAEKDNTVYNVINGTDIPIKADKDRLTYGGYNMMGYIEIPDINVKYPVLEKVTKRSLEIAVAIFTGPGLNEKGNTVIVGHNYRNGVFFSELHELEIDDIIYITDRNKTKMKYKVYNVYSTTSDDSRHYNRDTDGKREITLETCSDTGQTRVVVLAREVAEEENKNNIFNQMLNGDTETTNNNNNNQ